MRILYVYSTSSCHLCELALEILYQESTSKKLILIDIAEDDTLLSRYGTCIPVIKRDDNLEELFWPFTTEDVKSFLT